MPESAATPSPEWRPAGHCAVFACDIDAFGNTSRNDHVREHMHKALYQGLESSFQKSEIPLDGCYHEDRGDGVMVIVPPDVATERLVTSVVDRLRAELRHYNEVSSETAQIRLRVAVHTGEAHWDGRGIVSTAVNHTFRILDAQPFKDALRASGSHLALIVSQQVYDDVVRHGRGLIDPGEYHKVGISVKETASTAWIRVPGPNAPRAEPSPDTTPEPSAQMEPASSTDPRRRGTTRSAARSAFDDPMTLFELVDSLLEVSMMASERGREQVVGALRMEIAGMIPRHSQARPDLFSIVRTCLDYPGGLQELLTTIKRFAGDSLPVYRLEQTIARILPPAGAD
ncbi:effector-associated domain 2-containing protein [Actinomadura scrupuli]|uniref:effector-associated domain 2-containing protein n=1 Tax=Actinomadura scrupuli TaxID=559629 RepID=UPI003D986616